MVPVKFDKDGLPIPQQKEKVSFDKDGLPIPVKKKEISEPALETGGKAGTSALPSGLTPRTDVVGFKEPKVSGEDTALARRIQRQQQQAIASTGVKLPAAPKVVAEEKAAQRAIEPKLPPSEIKEGQSYISNLVSALDRGFYTNLVSNPIKGLATVIQQGTSAMTGGRVKEGPVSDFLNSFADKFDKAIKEVTPQDKEFQGSLSDQFAQALGQVGALVLTGGAGAGGRGAAVIAAPVSAGKMAPVIGGVKELAKQIATPASISAGLTVGQSEFERAKERGATDEQAFEAFYKNAATGSILEKIPVMQFLKRFNNATSGGVVNYLKTKGVAGITGGLEEATTEVLQQLYANKTAQDIYNVNQNIFEGITESGGIGFGVGFLLNAMGAQAKLLRQQGREEEAQMIENQEQEFKAQAEGKAPAEPITPITPAATEEVIQEGVIEETPRQKYRVEYFDPVVNQMTHSFFDTREEGDAFTAKLTDQQKSKGVQGYFQETTEPSMKVGEVAPQVPPTTRIPKERAAQLREQIKIEEVGEEVAPQVPAAPEKAPEVEEVVGEEVAPKLPAAPEKTQAETAKEQTIETDLLIGGQAAQRRKDGKYTKDNVEFVRNEKGQGVASNVTGEVRFTNEVSLPFRYKLVEAETLQPSHQDGIRNPNHFIPEAQPKNRNDVGSLMAEDSFASKPRFEELGENTNAYSGAPVVNERGEVIQGNNRSAGLRKGYKAGNQQYKNDLSNNAEQFGFTKEQVDGMREPILVREVAVSDEGAIEIGNYDVKDLETGGKRRLDATTITRRMPYDVKARISELLFTGEETLNQAIRANQKRLLEVLNPYLNQAQRNTITKEGVLTDAGIKDVEDIVKHFLFDNGDTALPDLFENLSATQKEGLKKALPYIFSTSPDKSIVPDIQEAILAVNDFNESGAGDFNAWLSQGDMFANGATPRDKYTPLEIEIARTLVEIKTQKEIAKKFANYSDLVRDKPADMFEAARPGKTRAEGIKEVFKTEDYAKPISERGRKTLAREEKPTAEPSPKAGDAARRLAEKLREGKINKPGTAKASTGFDVVWDAALEVIATSLEAGATIADSIEDGLNYIKSTQWYKSVKNKEEFEQQVKDILNNEYAVQVETAGEISVRPEAGVSKEVEGGKPPAEPKKPTEEGEGAPEKGQRRFTERMMESPLEKAVKKGVAATLEYTKQTNAMSVAQAQEVLDTLGEDKAYNVLKDEQTNGAVRVVLGQVLIKRYNELAKKAKTKEEKDLYTDATIDIAEYVTTKLATDAGQTIQAFKLWEQLTPEAQLAYAVKQKKKSARRNIDKVRKDVDNLGNKFKKANEDAVKEILKSEEVNQSVKKDTQESISKAKERANKARQKRADIINKYKGKGGITLTSGGLTKEGIEFVGEVAVTYIEEGIAEIQVIAEKIFADIKIITGSSPNDKVKQEVVDIANKELAKSDIKKVKSVSDQKLKINEVAIKHFTEAEKIKKNLAQKFMDEADMSESNAQALAKRFEDAFDRVVSRKKAEILAKEKKRFDRIQKAVNEQAGKKAEKKTLQDEIIRYSNLGAFSSEDMLDNLAKKFELGQLTKEQAIKIQELAEKVQKAPEGSPKREATEDLLAYQANINKGDWGEVAQGIWYANILSGYRTHEKNIVSTLFNSLADLGTEIIADPKGAPYIIAGYMEGVRKKGMLEAMRTLKTGRSPIHVQAVEIPDILERRQFAGGGYNPANWFKYVGRAMKAEDVLSFQGLKEARAWQLARREAEKYGFNTWSKSGWKKVNDLLLNTQERYEIAREQAESEGLKPGSRDLERRIYELMENSRPEAMSEDAYNFAAHGTFNYNSDGTLGALTNAFAKSVLDLKIGGVQPGRFVIPFTRIITNVINNSLDYSPLGIVRAAKGARGFKSFDEMSLTKGSYRPLTPEQRRVVLIKAAVGISFATIIQYMASSGLIEISGEGPEDEKKKAQLREQGWQPYSIKIGDTWYSYLLTPLVLTLGWMGNLNDAAKYGKEDEQTLLRRASIASLKFGGMIADLTWINSAATFLGAISEPRIGEQQKQVEKSLAGMARGFVPFAQNISQLTQAYNSTFGIPAKQVNDSWEALYQDIPIARNSLNDKINALGEPVIKDIDIMWSKEKADPVWSYLTKKQGWVAPLNKKTVLVFDMKLKQDRPLTDDEFYELSKRRGTIIKNNVEELMKNGYIVKRGGRDINVSGEDLTSTELNDILSKRIEPFATREAKKQLFGEKGKKSKRRKKQSWFS